MTDTDMVEVRVTNERLFSTEQVEMIFGVKASAPSAPSVPVTIHIGPKEIAAMAKQMAEEGQ
jgi:hypothetical protein